MLSNLLGKEVVLNHNYCKGRIVLIAQGGNGIIYGIAIYDGSIQYRTHSEFRLLEGFGPSVQNVQDTDETTEVAQVAQLVRDNIKL